MSSKPSDERDYGIVPFNIKHECAYRLVAFTLFDEDQLDTLVGQEYYKLGQLPENIPLSRIFTTNDHDWVNQETEEVALGYKEFPVYVSRAIPKIGERRFYKLHDEGISLSGIMRYIDEKIINANNGPNGTVISIEPERYDHGILSTPRPEPRLQSTIEVYNLGLLRFFDADATGPLVIADIYQLSKQ